MVLAYANAVTTTTKKNGYVTLRFNNSDGVTNQGVRLNSNSTWQGANAIGDSLSNMYLSFIGYSLGPTANAIISRGSNIVFQAHPGQEGEYDFSGTGVRIEKGGEPQGNVSVRFSGPGTVIMKLKKNSTTQTALE